MKLCMFQLNGVGVLMPSQAKPLSGWTYDVEDIWLFTIEGVAGV